MKHKRRTVTLMILLTLLLSVGGTMAQDPHPAGEVSITAEVNSRISYQGVLKEDSIPVTGSRDMTFRLYSDDACTTQVGGDISMPGVPVSDGLFSVALDVAHDDIKGQGLWLEVEVGGIAIVCQEIMAVPYALSLRPGATIVGEKAGSPILTVENSSTANDSKAIRGYASAAGGFTAGVNGRTDSSSTGAKGVWGYAAGGGQTYGETASTDGRGVYGHATAASGETYGVYGQTDSMDGYGVYGYNGFGNGTGVYGDGWRGVYGIGSAYGVHGYGWRGVYGQATSADGYGVQGENSYGGIGVSGTGITGVHGVGTDGVHGQTNNVSGRGVYGEATATMGTNYGVYGETNSPSGYGVYYVGGLGGTGLKTTIVGTKDHGWRQLYAVESPGNWFEDFGSGQLVEGKAVVDIEAIYAQTVNLERDYRVFLTPVGDYCDLYVAEKATASFTIRAHDDPSCSISFDYRLVAKRLGYEELRLATAEAPPSPIEESPGGEP